MTAYGSIQVVWDFLHLYWSYRDLLFFNSLCRYYQTTPERRAWTFAVRSLWQKGRELIFKAYCHLSIVFFIIPHMLDIITKLRHIPLSFKNRICTQNNHLLVWHLYPYSHIFLVHFFVEVYIWWNPISSHLLSPHQMAPVHGSSSAQHSRLGLRK